MQGLDSGLRPESDAMKEQTLDDEAPPWERPPPLCVLGLSGRLRQ